MKPLTPAKTLTNVSSRSAGKHSRSGCESLIRQLVAEATRESGRPGVHTKPESMSEAKTMARDPSAGIGKAVRRLDSTVVSENVLLEYEFDGIRCVLARTDSEATTQQALSPREQEIARMIAKGYPNKAIAGVLDISIWTVATHLRRIFAKYGVNSRAAMVAAMMREGMT